MSFQFTPENLAKAQHVLTRYPNKQAATLPLLWIAQKQHGYLPLDVQEYVAKFLDVSPAHVYGVVSFYTMFKDKPVGKYHLQVCRTLSCALRGSEELFRHLENKHGLKDGDISTDGTFSVEGVECLASCGTAPVVQVNEAYVENVTPQQLDQLMSRLATE